LLPHLDERFGRLGDFANGIWSGLLKKADTLAAALYSRRERIGEFA